VIFLVQVFKEEIENPNQPGGPIIDPQNIKAIFGGIPPIFEVHVKIRDELSEIINNWQEDALVGNVILKHVSLCHTSMIFVYHSSFSTD
jgi:hypothetical protein